MKKTTKLPFYFIMLVPLIVYGKVTDTGLVGFTWISDNSEIFDMLLYYKRIALIMTGCLLAVWGVVKIRKKRMDIKKMKIFIPLAVYVLLAFLSSIISPQRKLAFGGAFEQFEDMWVIIGYFLICIYAYTECCEEFFTATGILSVLFGAIGTFQYFGLDFYRTDAAQIICMPWNLHDMSFQVTVESGRSYCSLSNPNYVGMFCCLTMPLMTVLAFVEKNYLKKILYAAADILLLCSLIGSRSRSGIIVLALCMLVLTVIFRKKAILQLRNSRLTVVCVVLVIFIGAAMFAGKWNYFSESIGEIFKEGNEAETLIEEIVTGDDSVKITYNGKTVFLKTDYDNSTLKESVLITDASGALYDTYEKGKIIYFSDKELNNLTIEPDKNSLKVHDGSFYWYFSNQTEDNTWQYINVYGKADKLVSDEIEVFHGLDGKERILNGRGYIWSRTIPLLKKYFILGSGQDSFVTVFPNNDYLGLARWGYKDIIINKPHCMYMQIAVQSGMLSLIMLMAFWCIYFMSVIRNKKKSRNYELSAAIAVGVLGYLLTGLTNDSNVGVAPLFWAYIGMGFHYAKNSGN